MSWLEEVAKDEIQQPERPVSSQLMRIEQDVKAALERQARLNTLVDGQAERQRAIFSEHLEAVEQWASGVNKSFAVIEQRQSDILRSIIGHVNIDGRDNEGSGCVQARLATYQATLCGKLFSLGDRLAAIEAKLEKLIFVNAQSRSASKLTQAADTAMECFERLPKPEQARRLKQIKALKFSKKPSHKARR